jgi:4-hydroxy-2-oxoheptanedioate aldolase
MQQHSNRHEIQSQGIIIDCEHGHISDDAMHSATAAIASMGVSPLVRIRMTHPDLIKRALDAGAQ